MTLDELVIKLLIDPSGVKQGAKEATAATAKLSADMVVGAEKGEKAQTSAFATIAKGWNAMAAMQRKTAAEHVQNSKAMAAGTETIVQSGEKALRTFGALFLLFAGASSVKSFVTDMLGVDAALGRTAKSIGQTPEALSGIGRAVERMGGTFNGAVGGLKGLSDAFESMRTTGNSAIMEPMARLQGLSGKAITFGKDVHENFLSIADALKAEMGKDPAMADYLGRQILGDEGLTNLAKKGRAGVLAEEGKSPKITKEQAEDAQKLQAQLAAVHQEFQQLGNSILMDFGPPVLKAVGWVRDLITANRELIETKVKEWVGEVGKWFTDHRGDIESFGKAVGDIATAAGSLATAFASQSPAVQALEAFAVLMGGRVLSAIKLVGGAMTALGSIPAPAWALAAMGLSAAAQWQGAKETAKILGSDGSTKNDVVVDPESGMATKVGAGEGNQGTGPNTGSNPKTGAIAWFKSLFGAGQGKTVSSGAVDGNALRRNDEAPVAAAQGGALAWLKSKLGFGEDPKVKENIDDTAKATKGILDVLKVQKDGVSNASAIIAAGGATTSSGGLGGSGRHVGGGSGRVGGGDSAPGASLHDRGQGGHGFGGGSGASAAADPNLPIGNAPGASGYGTINAYWKGPLDKRGEGGFTGPKEMFDYLKSQGATDNEALLLTGSAASESSFNPRAVHDGGTGHGLFGHKDTRLDMRGKNWQQQSMLALGELRRTLGKRVDAARTPEELTDIEMHNERPRGYKPGNPRAGDNYMGRLNSIRRFSALTGRPAPQASAPTASAPAGAPTAAVTDAEVFAARQRILNGSRSPQDHALIDRYKEQQTHPEVKVTTPPHPTVADAAHHLLRIVHSAQRLNAHRDAKPVPVTDAGAMKVQERTFGAFAKWGARHPDQLDHARALRHGQAAALDRMTRVAMAGSYASHSTHNVDRSVTSDTRIAGGIHIHTVSVAPPPPSGASSGAR